MENDFELVIPAMRGTKAKHLIESGHLRLSVERIYFAAPVLAALGNPKRLAVSVSQKDYMIKLTGTDDTNTGFVVHTAIYKGVNASQEPARFFTRFSKNSLLARLPKGIYRPTGGSIYSYAEDLTI